MRLISSLTALAFFAAGNVLIETPAFAGSTEVATISGCYDCLGNYDTPVLQINNTSGGDFLNAQMVLTGYQALNSGKTNTVTLGTLGAGSTTTLVWGSLPGGVPSYTYTPGALTVGDYDDEYLNTSSIIPTSNCGSSAGCVGGGGPQWYADVGNFQVVFTATISGGTYNGQPVYSVFSPTTNATGGFVPWEGLDPNGYSEQPCCDVHTGVVTGDLANIYLGTVPAAPEPSTWAMLLLGFVGLGLVGYRQGVRAKVA